VVPCPHTGVRASTCLGVALILLLAAAVRFAGITDRELWLDESCTYYYVHHLFNWPADGPDPWLELTTVPYTVLLHAWTRVAGETILGLRSFSAVAGLLTVVALMYVAARVAGRRAGAIAGALAALHPLQVYYSQEARVYALWCLECTLLLWSLYQAARLQSPRWWVAYALLVVMTTATHYYTLFWLPASAVAVLLSPRALHFAKQWTVTHAVLGVVLLPFIMFIIVPLTGRGSQMWLEDVWASYPPALALLRSCWALLPAGGYPEAYLGPLAAATGVLGEAVGTWLTRLVQWGPAALILLLLLVWGIRKPVARMTAQSAQVSPASGRHVAFFALLTLATLATPFLYSWLVRPAYVVGRYDLCALPALLLTVTLLLDGALRNAGSRIAATAFLLLCSAATTVGLHAVPVQIETPERVRRLQEHVGPHDLVVSVGMYRWFLAYELNRQGFSTRIISFPPAHDRQVGWDNPRAELADPEGIKPAVTSTLTGIRRVLHDGARVWLLWQGDPTGPRWEVDSQLLAGLREAGYDVRGHDPWLGLLEVTVPATPREGRSEPRP